MHFVSPFFLDTLKKSKKNESQIECHELLEVPEHIPNLCVEGLACVGGLAQDRTLECHSQRYRDTSGDAALSSIFFCFQKFPTKSTSTALLFNRVSRRFLVTSRHTSKHPKKSPKRKTKNQNDIPFQAVPPTATPRLSPLSPTVPSDFPPTGCRCGRGCTFLPFPSLPLFLVSRQRHGSASGTVQLWSRTWRRLISQLVFL